MWQELVVCGLIAGLESAMNHCVVVEILMGIQFFAMFADAGEGVVVGGCQAAQSEGGAPLQIQ